ncbi:MaoC family dehydratase [Amycolatopsis sp. GM8]|uniref:MaoC family dehydratase n=1 Tax=Amycolatopsis sp. GM8 TaxID=2896530 RepID=UPI001F2C4B24|nr:MaoC family dehydratase [Amycolatopsis sp. GM8]
MTLQPDQQAPPYYFEDFTEGRVFSHHWGRTITESDATTFATQTHLYEPALFNRAYATHLGEDRLPVSGLLVFSIVLGLSVADLSESGGTFLGADDIRFTTTTHVGDTVYAASTVEQRRTSASRPGWGVVRWRTAAANQNHELVLSYTRTSLVRFRAADAGRS